MTEWPPVTISVPPTVTEVMFATALVMNAPLATPIMTNPKTSAQKPAFPRSTDQPTDTVTGASGERPAFACSACPAP